ncbi:MAG TPA: hypothetical protein VFJ64_02180 [Solirubrobacterales bacterium]|nr:hypothetical protein [Solirubrobacterales bacterium]
MLAFVALASLRPWEPDTVDPHLSVALGTAAVGDGVAIAPAPSSRPAGAGDADLARAVPAVQRIPVVDGAGPTLAVAQARAVSTIAVPPSAPPGLEPQPPASSQPAPAPEAPPPPQTVVTGSGGSAGGPSTAVVEVEPKPGCEGDEYEVTIRFVAEEIPSEEAEVEIVIRRVGLDGSESEIQLEGKFGDVGNLLEQVASEEDCVAVRVEPAGGEESADGSSESPVATASVEEELEPALP